MDFEILQSPNQKRICMIILNVAGRERERGVVEKWWEK